MFSKSEIEYHIYQCKEQYQYSEFKYKINIFLNIPSEIRETKEIKNRNKITDFFRTKNVFYSDI